MRRQLRANFSGISTPELPDEEQKEERRLNYLAPSGSSAEADAFIYGIPSERMEVRSVPQARTDTLGALKAPEKAGKPCGKSELQEELLLRKQHL